MPPPVRPLDFQPSRGPEPDLWESFTASFTLQQVQNSNEEGSQLMGAIQDARRALEEQGGDAARRDLKTRLMQHTVVGGFHADPRSGTRQRLADPIEQWLLTFEDYRASLPEADRHKVPTREQLIERGRERSIARYYEAQDVLSQTNDFGSNVVKFAGGMAGSMTDPWNVASLILLRYPATSILRTIGIEAAGGAITQAAIEPITFDYMKDLGIEYDLEDSIANVGMAGAGAGAFGGLWRAAEKGLVRLSGNTPIDEQQLADRRAAERVVKDADALKAENPFKDSEALTDTAAAARDRHYQETIRADEELRLGRPVTPQPEGPAPELGPRRMPDGVDLVDMDSLQRAPDLFQYKEADEEGVTEALKGVDVWQPMRAGMLIVWEDKAGKRFVVDGHQRHALAQRLRAQGHPPIEQPAFILRESAGVTSEQAMVSAAMKNLAEGSGTALDAARVLRYAPADVKLGLPPNSALVRDAIGIARLSDDGFGMVANGADPRWGALVGRLVEEQDLHAQVLRAVGKLQPNGTAAAESMIRDMLAAPRVTEQTMDLFGTHQVSELLIAERAQVKQAALALLTKNRQAFRVALQRQAELEASGNVMAAKRNREALDADTAAALRLEKDAHMKGWVSDQLSQAAKDLRDGAPLKQVVERVVASLRAGDPGSGAPGRAAGGPGRDAEGAGAGGREGEGGAGQAGQRAGASTKRQLIDGGPAAWRAELTRPDITTDDIERVLMWLGTQRKDVIAGVRGQFLDTPPVEGAIKADYLTEIREAVRASLAETDPAMAPAGLFDADPAVARMLDAEAALREPIPDEGARVAAEEAAPDEAQAKLFDEERLTTIEKDIREIADAELADPKMPLATFLDPETNELRPVAALAEELDYDKKRLQVLEACAYPGGKGKA